jgi:hypothetical protein
MKPSELRERLTDLGAEKITFHRDGTLTVKRSFFYTHGFTATKLGAKIVAALPNLRVVNANDEWRAWPHTSYFVVHLEVVA